MYDDEEGANGFEGLSGTDEPLTEQEVAEGLANLLSLLSGGNNGQRRPVSHVMMFGSDREGPRVSVQSYNKAALIAKAKAEMFEGEAGLIYEEHTDILHTLLKHEDGEVKVLDGIQVMQKTCAEFFNS